MKEIKIYNTLQCLVSSDTVAYNEAPESYADELAEALEKEDTDLAPYADSRKGETFYKKLHRTKITTAWIGGKLYGLCTCEVDDDWTDSDTEQMKSYLEGQYSDGWGEGFEQREICSYVDTDPDLIYDEESDEYYESEYDVRYDVCISFWQSNDNFKLMTESELKK